MKLLVSHYKAYYPELSRWRHLNSISEYSGAIEILVWGLAIQSFPWKLCFIILKCRFSE